MSCDQSLTRNQNMILTASQIFCILLNFWVKCLQFFLTIYTIYMKNNFFSPPRSDRNVNLGTCLFLFPGFGWCDGGASGPERRWQTRHGHTKTEGLRNPDRTRLRVLQVGHHRSNTVYTQIYKQKVLHMDSSGKNYWLVNLRVMFCLFFGKYNNLLKFIATFCNFFAAFV